MKKSLGKYSKLSQHWVGDGFPVRTLFSEHTVRGHLSPFLMLDYAGPVIFSPTMQRRGVGSHPHRGFETVTIVYEGEVEHRDSAGGGGQIGPGDVQWMTAGAGIVHEEFHTRNFARSGGMLEMVQLWVNLPAKHKMTRPRYQTVPAGMIPSVVLPDEAGTVRVIAGEYAGHAGPALTFTRLDVWDMRLTGGRSMGLAYTEARTLALVVLRGQIVVNGNEEVGEAELILFERAGTDVQIDAISDATILLLGGEPIDEPVVAHGPFVMNTDDEIRQAVVDYQSGRFGQLAMEEGRLVTQ